MKIEDFQVRVVHPEGMGFQIGKHLWVDQCMVLLTIRTDDGAEGIAGCTTYGPGMSVAYALKDIVGPSLLERDPFEREALWQSWFRLMKLYLSPQAIAVADLALWDLAGKVLGQPVHRLLGTYRTTLTAYGSTLTYPEIPEFVEKVAGFVDQGFQAIKLHTYGVPDKDIELCRQVRAAVGDNIALMIDAAGHYEIADALRVGRALEELNYEWMEMPIEDPFMGGYVDLARDLDISVTTGEVTQSTLTEAASALARGAWDIVRVDVCNSGGITGARKTAALAEAYGRRCELHSWGFVITQLANFQAMCAVPNCRYFEMPVPVGIFDYGMEGLKLNSDGTVTIPDRPGLGQVFDMEAMEAATIAKFGRD
ncbi:MAG: mandelate racemase/muconate lactonizing enzyme family protein [Chloroflexota bacterium]|nr:MAG: mandelate racemase/muconate lactonizing enzyme family protein [Chloroflexota bacterium]